MPRASTKRFASTPTAMPTAMPTAGRPTARSTPPPVSPVPVARTCFTWERVSANQCVAYEQYPVGAMSVEAEYFVPLLASALVQAGELPPEVVKPPMLLAAYAQLLEKQATDVLSIRYIEYTQLKPVKQPDLSQRAPPADSPEYVPEQFFESYLTQERQQMVQAPALLGGKHYEVTKAQNRPWSVRIITNLSLANYAEDEDGNTLPVGHVPYCMEVKLAVDGKKRIVALSFGENDAYSGRFRAWHAPDLALPVDDEKLSQMLFNESSRRCAHWPVEMPAIEPNGHENVRPSNVQTPGSDSGRRSRFSIIPYDDCMVHPTVVNKEMHYVTLTNFMLHKVQHILQFYDDSEEPIVSLVCRHVLDRSATDIIYLAAEDSDRSPDTTGLYAIDVEVLVKSNRLHYTKDVWQLFTTAYAPLRAPSLMPEMLRCWINEQEAPKSYQCITRFGRQSDDTFVAGNVAFKSGQFLKHTETEWTLLRAFFKDNPLMPMSDDYFPRHIVIPQCHVRYIVGTCFWTTLMPEMMLNNTTAARVAFAMGVAGLFATKYWAGQSGMGKGFPFTYIYSCEHNTGKTEILTMVNALNGFAGIALVAGDTTKPAIFEKLNLQSCLTLCIDDLVTRYEESVAFMQIGRAVYDRSERTVQGKIRKPHSSLMLTVRLLLPRFVL